MSVKLSLHPEAEADVADAIAFYDRQTAGLGSDFLGELLRTVERIEGAPEAGEVNRWVSLRPRPPPRRPSSA